jgi:hypothetical protein
VPSEEHLRDLCNCGYARGRCGRFPAEDTDSADAVRFSAVGTEGERLGIVFIFEKDHAPARHGTLEFLPGKDAFAETRENAVLLRQARAFAESYLRKR